MLQRFRSAGAVALSLISVACPIALPVDDAVRFHCSSDLDCPAATRCRANACWPMDAGLVDAVAVDASGRDLALTDLARLDQTGRDQWQPDGGLADASQPDAAACINRALHFNGTQWQATDPAADLDLASALTIEAWIKPGPDALRPSGFVMLVSHHDHNLSAGYALGIANKALELRIYGSAGPSFLRSAVALQPDVWQHVAGSFDGRHLRVFIDGVRQNEADVGNQTVNPCNCELRVGNSATTVGYYFYGEIDEVRLSRSARYSGNFSRPTAPPAVDADAVVVWHFAEGTGQTTADATGARQGRLGSEPGPDVRDPTWVEVPCVAAFGG